MQSSTNLTEIITADSYYYYYYVITSCSDLHSYILSNIFNNLSLHYRTYFVIIFFIIFSLSPLAYTHTHTHFSFIHRSIIHSFSSIAQSSCPSFRSSFFSLFLRHLRSSLHFFSIESNERVFGFNVYLSNFFLYLLTFFFRYILFEGQFGDEFHSRSSFFASVLCSERIT